MSDAADSRKARFVEDLLAYMRPEEKLGQLRILELGERGNDAVSGVVDDILDLVRGGSIGAIRGIESSEEAMQAQTAAVEQSRYGIPLFLASGSGASDVWPSPLAMAATWDPDLLGRVGRALSMQARAHGANWNASPRFDWQPRTGMSPATSFGQSATLTARLVSGIMTGLSRALHDDDCPSLATLQIASVDEGEMHGLAGFVREVLRTETPMAIEHTELAKALGTGPEGLAAVPLGRLQSIDRSTSADILAREFAEQAARLEADSAYRIEIDDAVRSVLRAKIASGLFRDPFAGFVQSRSSLTKLALVERKTREEVVRRATILLANRDELLPLSPDSGRILVTGGGAREIGTVCRALEEFGTSHKAVSGLAVREGDAGRTQAHPADGLAIGLACDAAGRADTVIVAISDEDCSDDEGGRPAKLAKPAQTMIRAIANANPHLVLVELTSVPVDLEGLGEFVSSRLLAWDDLKARESALGEILVGESGPSGRLPMDLPSENGASSYPFGHGLGYSAVRHSELHVELGSDRIFAQVSLANTGVHDVLETTQFYLRRPGEDAAHLALSQQNSVGAGATAAAQFEIGIETLGQLGSDGRYACEPGTFEIALGPNMRDLDRREVEISSAILRAMAATGANPANAAIAPRKRA